MKVLLGCGVDLYISSQDRDILEKTIMPYLAQEEGYNRILFVGCAWYTRGYRKVFTGKDYWTIEIDPEQARYGSSQHITDSVENVGQHFRENDLDAIICNGVFGWGLDEREAVEKAFQGCFDCLREGGVFVLGWNDLPGHVPFPLEDCVALRSFTRLEFPPLGSTRVVAEAGRHSFDFFVKKAV
ncbi:class I SAM-dependent methyltransferase [Roseimicrobium sp. ORNL1]|uniref:class I SAM-dependent methyltransferase n=1 Tax=Roseimicrobium sp. ORNL1 TaxID=2711231 RepID=UPI0013E0FB22|nr:class I SAM-dependent methyltransferase [Roseimicrobium sp. ORNL1]QIF02936.1 class I SAM-dependent methyltransferase [Roseimicrobium sp. ORNL1]